MRLKVESKKYLGISSLDMENIHWYLHRYWNVKVEKKFEIPTAEIS